MRSNVAAIDPSTKSDMKLTERVNKHRRAVLIVRAFEIPLRVLCGGFSDAVRHREESNLEWASK